MPAHEISRPALKRRINKAVARPQEALLRGWYHDPAFCHGFFDRCEDLALAADPQCLPLAHRAVEIAAANGDPCLINTSEGLLAHAHLSRSDRFWAGRTLEKSRRAALDCCPPCRSRFFRRLGDVLAEEKQPRESLEAFARSLEEGGADLGPDALGRVLFPRSVAHHFNGQRERALSDAGQVLEFLSLESPRGFFHDTAACIGVYLLGGDPCHDARALELLTGFLERIKGYPWKAARVRVAWTQGHIHARLGEVTRAAELLEIAWRRLLADGLPREIVAVSLDLAQLKCRPSNLREDNLRSARRRIEKCLGHRDDLGEDHVRRLREAERVVRRWPESAFDELGALRGSFIAPVPGLLGERIGPR